MATKSKAPVKTSKPEEATDVKSSIVGTLVKRILEKVNEEKTNVVVIHNVDEGIVRATAGNFSNLLFIFVKNVPKNTSVGNLAIRNKFEGFRVNREKINVIEVSQSKNAWSDVFIDMKLIMDVSSSILSKNTALKEGAKKKVQAETMVNGFTDVLDERQWSFFKTNVFNIFTQILGYASVPPSVITSITSDPDCVKVFMPAFVHKSYRSATFRHKNYEMDEHIGDSILSLVLKFVVLKKEPRVTVAKLNDYKKELLGKKVMADVGRSLGLSVSTKNAAGRVYGNIAVVGEVGSQSIIEDVLEAIFSVLYTCVEMKSLSGIVHCSNLFDRLFGERIGSDVSSPFDKLTDIFKKMYLTKENHVDFSSRKYDARKIQYVAKFTDYIIENLMDSGLDVSEITETTDDKSPKIKGKEYTVVSNDEFTAKAKLADLMIADLEKIGLNQIFAETIRFRGQLTMMESTLPEEVEQIRKFMEENNSTMFVTKNKSNKDIVVIQDSEGKNSIVAILSPDVREDEIPEEIVRKAISGINIYTQKKLARK